MNGFLLGGAVYPLNDHWVALEKGGDVLIHGPVRWFAGHTFEGTLQTAGGIQVSNDANQQQDETIPAMNANQIKSPPQPRLLISHSNTPAERNGNPNITPVNPKDLPTVSKLLAAVPPTTVFAYVLSGMGATLGIAATAYFSVLKPRLLNQKKLR
ncbi:UNVERIFIED_CONTAM: hypothetical protein HDU68_002579 [Siphonaria sp. JEL0065]|nr:hypothetical protein HDU68_002579 [Siphonaria sp. JEL0065]